MATGNKYTNVYSKKFLSWQEFSTYIIDYLKNLIKDGVASFVTGGLASGFFSSVTLSSDAVDQIDVGAFKGADKESNIIEQASPRSGYEKDVPFENTTAADYHIGVHHFEVPDEAEIGARSGEAEYRYFREDIGEVAHPDSVTDDGDGTITLVVNSVTEARDNTDRYVLVWLVNPLSAVDWIEELQIVWFGGASENRIATVAKLGQDTISTDANDYWVALRGISVKRDTDIRTDKSYIYVGKATGNSGGIPTFSTADQKLLESIYDFEQEVIDARTSDIYGAKASLDLRIEEVDSEVNTARDGKTTLQDRLEGEAEFNIIIDSADKGDYTTLAAYIADSPAAGDRVLLNLDEEITGTTMIIPANILLKQQKGKKLWCDEIALTTVLQFSDGVVTEGDLLLELSHTGTLPTAVSFNGDDNNHSNVVVKNTSTGTITNAFKLESGKDGNKARGEVLNPSGTVTNILTDSSGKMANDVVVRNDGGITFSTRQPRTATLNQGDSPAPDTYGGGAVWVEFRTTGTTEIVLDNSIDWRDRFIAINGYGIEGATSALPPAAGDDGLSAHSNADAPTLDDVLTRNIIGFLYTEAGGDGSADPRMRIYHDGATTTGALYAKSADGNLAFKLLGSPTNEADMILKIDYSPVQNHY